MPVPAPHPSVIEDTDEHSSENRELERVATRLGDTGTRDLPVTRLSGATAVVQELNQVNLYKPQQYSSESLAVQGFLNMPSNDPDPNLTPNGDQDSNETGRGRKPTASNKDDQSSQEAPPNGYLTREFDWYEPGKFFSIWAPAEFEIHGKNFILLKSHNNEGMGVLVRSLKREEKEQFESSSGTYRTHMALRHQEPHSHGNGVSVDRSKEVQPGEYATIHLDIHSGREVEPDTFVFLKHTYNIAFTKYACKDLGIVRKRCLRELRAHFLRYLVNSWEMEEEMRATYA